MRYRYYINDNTVICVSSYARKSVKGIAKCNPNDSFNLETGKRLARIRCDYKVALKRVRRAKSKFEEATDALDAAQEHVNRMRSYYVESFETLVDLKKNLKDLEKSVAN